MLVEYSTARAPQRADMFVAQGRPPVGTRPAAPSPRVVSGAELATANLTQHRSKVRLASTPRPQA